MSGLVNLVKPIVVAVSLAALVSCGPPSDECNVHPERCLPVISNEPDKVDATPRTILNDVVYPIISSPDPTYFKRGNIAVDNPLEYE